MRINKTQDNYLLTNQLQGLLLLSISNAMVQKYQPTIVFVQGH